MTSQATTRALLLENVHPDASAALTAEGFEVDTVKGALDSDFTIHLGPRQTITGWHIDHRPVIYDIMNAERGPLAPRVIQSHINA